LAIAVRKLRPEDDRAGFRSGDVDLDRFFHKYAGQNQFRHHIGTTYVAIDGGRILGFVLARQLSKDYGCLGVVVDAKPDAIAFCERYGFVEFPSLSGQLGDRPEPSLMFLELGAIPDTGEQVLPE